MTLANLFRIGQLKEHPADAPEIARLLAAAERCIADARVRSISPETRFDAAYRSITLYPARILGLDGVLGSIKPGKSASATW